MVLGVSKPHGVFSTIAFHDGVFPTIEPSLPDKPLSLLAPTSTPPRLPGLQGIQAT